MKLYHPLLSDPVIINENYINIIVIENRLAMRNFINELIEQINGCVGNFCLSNDQEVLDISKNIELVTDLFNLDFESKKVVNSINQLVASEANNYPDVVSKIISDLNMFVMKINASLSYSVNFSPINSFADIAKVFNFKIDQYAELPEKILNYINMYRNFFNKKIMIFYNLKSLLSEEELNGFYKDILYNKYNVLLIEEYNRQPNLTCEIIRIIDKDLCVI